MITFFYKTKKEVDDLYKNLFPSCPPPKENERYNIYQFFAEDPEIEEHRLETALEELHLSIDRLLAAEIGGLWGEPREVIEAYKLLASDPTWAEKLREGVRGGLSAEASIDRLRREHRARFEKVKDPYLRERLHDLEDLDNRLLRMLAGGDQLNGIYGYADTLGIYAVNKDGSKSKQEDG